jgi:glycosyltransferase involved in cell wall biosynthesis
MNAPAISIVVPCRNEAANIPPLLDEIAAAMRGRDFEVIVVDDASSDDTPAVLAAKARDAHYDLRHLRHPQRSGQSLALRTGAWAAQAPIVATIDGDGQNDPRFIPMLVDASWRPARRLAPLRASASSVATRSSNRASRFANGLRSAVLHDRTRDTGCGLKAIRTEILRKLPFFDGTHRFVPALVMQEGYDVVHIDVVDRPRLHGTSNYGILDRGSARGRRSRRRVVADAGGAGCGP